MNHSNVILPVPRLTHKAGQHEAQAKANEGVDGPNNPQGGSDVPGGLVENASNHSDDDDECESCNCPYLCTSERTDVTKVGLCVCFKSSHASKRVRNGKRNPHLQDLFGQVGPFVFEEHSQTDWNKKGHQSDA